MYTDDIIQTINNHNGTLPSKLYAFICDDSKQIRQVSYNGYENRFYMGFYDRDENYRVNFMVVPGE